MRLGSARPSAPGYASDSPSPSLATAATGRRWRRLSSSWSPRISSPAGPARAQSSTRAGTTDVGSSSARPSAATQKPLGRHCSRSASPRRIYGNPGLPGRVTAGRSPTTALLRTGLQAVPLRQSFLRKAGKEDRTGCGQDSGSHGGIPGSARLRVAVLRQRMSNLSWVIGVIQVTNAVAAPGPRTRPHGIAAAQVRRTLGGRRPPREDQSRWCRLIMC
jgi:hypothetical protein